MRHAYVLAKEDAGRDGAGIVRFHHRGLNQDGAVVFEGERTVLVKRREQAEAT